MKIGHLKFMIAASSALACVFPLSCRHDPATAKDNSAVSTAITPTPHSTPDMPGVTAISWPEEQVLPSFPPTAEVLDLFYLRDTTPDELVLFASLKGLVNRKKPRMFSYEGDAHAEGPYTWIDSLGLKYNEVKDRWDLMKKYKDEVKGLLIYDPEQPDTINLASTLAAEAGAVIASPKMAEVLSQEPYRLPILEDFRGRFTSKLDVYQTLYKKYWPTLTHRLIIGLNPRVHRAALREYASALGVATIWLDLKIPEESQLLDLFLSTMDPGGSYMGWWPVEEAGIKRGSEHGIPTIASDWSSNLSVHSGTPRDIKLREAPIKPQLKNKIYVAFILSDGDNLQYVEHLMRKLWNNPDRGKVPMGWTVSPAMVDAMPGALNFLHQSATENDNLISGPSGYGYIYPDFWKNKESLKAFVAKTEQYNQKAGLNVVTVWNTIKGAINPESGEIFARNAPSLLGMTSQNTGGGLTVFNGSLPGLALSCNYCTSQQAMLDHIKSASKDWSKNEPRFVMIQSQPWTNVTPSTFLRVKEALGSDYEVVRPDHLFQLLREAKGLAQP